MVEIKVIQENGVDVHPETEPNAITNFKKSIIDIVYPVGSIYISANDVNPGTLFGGTWAKHGEGRMLLCANSSYPLGGTGGSATVSLSINEMPSHSHSAGNHSHGMGGAGGHSHEVIDQSGQHYYYRQSGYNGTGGGPLDTAYKADRMAVTTGVGDHTHSIYESGITIGSSGGGGPHNNMPPYISTNIWKRTA